jgi:hypothetical protein
MDEKASCTSLEGSLMRYLATCTNADGKGAAAEEDEGGKEKIRIKC